MKNVNVMVAAFAAAFTVAIVAELPITEALITNFFNKFGAMLHC